ncbi:MAG: hypothetical protein P4L53_19760 [Candidatus Obscuribacterales bacterium]|nr:hypothetical protein [Candidatus Obscuribacterales bacterium]
MGSFEVVAKVTEKLAPDLVETGVRLLEDSAVAKRIGAALSNPYLEKYESLPFIQELKAKFPGRSMRSLSYYGDPGVGHALRREFAYAIPNEEALSEIQSHGPVVEIGAGKGYWASLLRQRGARVAAFDKFPIESGRNEYHDVGDRAFTEIAKGSVEQVRKFPDHKLLLVWPPPNEPMALNALNQYKGKTVFYVGEEHADYIGDMAFQRQLNERFEIKKQIPLPNFPGYDDMLHVYERK